MANIATNVGAVYIDLNLNTEGLSQGFDEIESGIKVLDNVFGNFQEYLTQLFSREGFSSVYEAFDGVESSVIDVEWAIEQLVSGFEELIERSLILEGGLENAAEKADFFSLATELVSGVVSEFDGKVDKLTDSLMQIPFEILESDTLSFADSLDNVSDAASGFGQNFAQVISNVKDKARGVSSRFLEIFTQDIPNGWNNMLSSLGDGWDNTWSGIVGAMRGFANNIIETINNMINGLNRFQIDIPAWLGGGSFGFNIPNIPTIPALATGGIVAAPTLALIGEAGREAVLPLDNNTSWMTELSNMIATAINRQNTNHKMQTKPTQLNLYMDTALVAEALIDDITEVAGLNGIDLVLK